MEHETERTCPTCGASHSEIRVDGHRRLPDGRLCPEGCNCIPQHFNLEEHRAGFGDEDTLRD
ncbi:MAG: hypothetical protein HY906_24710 [Deltaproteobacteria bacterium]|nr:hypothetical protein [Deltaproteobacteria bacterium]